MLAAVFPGQGSQKPGMGHDLYDHIPEARAVFDEVSAATSIDVPKLCFETDEDTLRQTQNAQMALYTCGVAAYRALAARGVTAKVMAGHSVGEYAALASAGIVSIAEGGRLVQRRGDLMARSGNLRPGGMAAILGLERDALAEVCRGVSTADSVAVIANDNCPGQLVISGDKDAVERASAAAIEAGAKRALPLNVSGAFHSPLMEEAAASMGEALRGATFGLGDAVVYANVTAQAQNDPAQWAGLLEAQLKNPVRWTESMQAMISDGVTQIVECGTGEVLCGLMKRISRDVASSAVQDVASLEAFNAI
jgi:[acyl-carrier-protein] S-malonyltransferase